MSRIRCESFQSGERCGRAATRYVSWETEDGRKHESSMCATCFAVVRNMLLKASVEALPTGSKEP